MTTQRADAGKHNSGRAGQLVWFALLAFLSLLLFGGGGSRPDVQSLIVVRIGAVLLAAFAISAVDRPDLARLKPPLLLFGTLALVMVSQLVPLPPAIWMQLPGRAFYAEAAAAAGIPQPWRPVSITPDLTLNSLLAVLPPFAVLLALAALPRRQSQNLLLFLLGAAMLSALFGVAQLSAGPDSPFFLYRITNSGNAVGLFANRNHQAIFLALALPMLAFWASSNPFDVTRRPSAKAAARFWISAAAALFLIILILATGSRGGLGIAAIGLVGSAAILKANGQALSRLFSRRARLLMAAAFAVLALGIGAALVFASRAETLQRLVAVDLASDARFAHLPRNLELAQTFMPFGSGFGSFDVVFRQVEPAESLGYAYLNHAHNDVVELAITAGLPGLAIAVAFALWWLGRSYSLLYRAAPESSTRSFGRLGSIMIVMLAAGSLFDYPLRTPMLSVLFAIACAWMCADSGRAMRGEAASR